MESSEVILTLSKSISAISYEKISCSESQPILHSSNKNFLYAYMMVEAFMNGYIDIVTYLLFHVYTVTVTGNLALLAIVLVQQNPDWVFVAYIIAVTLSYFVGCYIAYAIIGDNENPANSISLMVPIQILCLL